MIGENLNYNLAPRRTIGDDSTSILSDTALNLGAIILSKESRMIGIYGIFNQTSMKVYIGQSVQIRIRLQVHKRNLEAGIHRNVHLQRAWNHYGGDSFAFIVLEEIPIRSKAILDMREKYWLSAYGYPNDKKCYNAKDGGANGSPSEIVRNKISISNKLSLIGIIQRKILHRSLRGRQVSEETKQKIAVTSKGRQVSEATRQKLREWNVGKIISQETREKISRGLKGKQVSDETRQKLSRANIGKHVMTEEIRANMSAAHIGLTWTVVNGKRIFTRSTTIGMRQSQ